MNATVATSRFTDLDAMVVAVEGELDLVSTSHVETPAREAIALKQALVFDLSRCSFIDSTALRLLLRVHSALTAADLDLPMALVVGDSPVRKVLSIAAIDDRVPLLPTLESAEGWLRLQKQELPPIASPLP